jgi:hypothetical protein
MTMNDKETEQDVELSLGKIVVDIDAMELVSLKLSAKFHRLFGTDGLARADILRDLEDEINRLRETSIKEYIAETTQTEKSEYDTASAEPFAETERKLGLLAEDLANSWFQQQAAELHRPYYVFFNPSCEATKTFGAVLILTDQFDQSSGLTLADNRRIQPSWTVEQARIFIREIMRSLPILPIQ